MFTGSKIRNILKRIFRFFFPIKPIRKEKNFQGKAPVKKGLRDGNRKTRREDLCNRGMHNVRKGPVMKIIGTTRFIMYAQRIMTDKGVKVIEHCVAVSPRRADSKKKRKSLTYIPQQ